MGIRRTIIQLKTPQIQVNYVPSQMKYVTRRFFLPFRPHIIPIGRITSNIISVGMPQGCPPKQGKKKYKTTML